MNENFLFVSVVLGALIAFALMARIFTSGKSGFFLGLVVLVLTFEMLFSWSAQTSGASMLSDLPLPLLLNYLLIPPSLWIFVKFKTGQHFQLKNPHLLLFVPAFMELILQLLSLNNLITLQGNLIWVWFSEYLPLLWFLYVLLLFWRSYFGLLRVSNRHKPAERSLPYLKLPALMFGLTLLGIFWVTFTFIGWKYYFIMEYLIITLIFGLAFLNFLEGPSFPVLVRSKQEFSQYDDPEQLQKINFLMAEKKLFLEPSLTLKDFSEHLGLPERYVSQLINQYHGKNFREYLNHFRVEEFITKVRSDEKEVKTLLALAMESGFSSKSTFNQVFKQHTGKTPSAFLN